MRFFSQSSASGPLKAAQQALDHGNAREALGALMQGFMQDPAHRPLYSLAARCLRAFGGEEEAALFEGAAQAFRKPGPFYELGYHFVEVENYDMAVPFLERALALSPGDLRVAAELALAYNGSFRPQRALEILGVVDYKAAFPPAFLYYWTRMLCNERTGIQEFVDGSRQEVSGMESAENREWAANALGKLEECVQRLETISKPQPLIQHWHFIQYGAAILDYFDERTAPEGLSVAGGRWIAVWGSPERIAGVLYKLKRFLEELQRWPDQVIALPDRDSTIVGRAAAEILGLPFLNASEEDASQPGSLVIVGDNRRLETVQLQKIQENQTLFSLNLHFLSAAPVTPDITGLMSQSYYFPWEGGIPQINPDGRETTFSAPDERPAQEIASEIANVVPEEDPGFEEILKFYRERSGFLKARPGQRRLGFKRDSPVAASYFT